MLGDNPNERVTIALRAALDQIDLAVARLRLARGAPMSEERDMQVYELHRDEDVSGISGSGYVADAVVFHNGKCVVSWRGPKSSIVVYDALEDAEAIHGHNGSTRFVPRGLE